MSTCRYSAHYREADSACHELDAHLRETAAYAKRFAAKIGLECSGELLGLIHDRSQKAH